MTHMSEATASSASGHRRRLRQRSDRAEVRVQHLSLPARPAAPLRPELPSVEGTSMPMSAAGS